jgi:hypothetical protein
MRIIARKILENSRKTLLIDEHILKDTHILKLNILGCDNPAVVVIDDVLDDDAGGDEWLEVLPCHVGSDDAVLLFALHSQLVLFLLFRPL